MKKMNEYEWTEDERLQLRNEFLILIENMNKQGLNLAEVQMELFRELNDAIYDYEQELIDRGEDF